MSRVEQLHCRCEPSHVDHLHTNRPQTSRSNRAEAISDDAGPGQALVRAARALNQIWVDLVATLNQWPGPGHSDAPWWTAGHVLGLPAVWSTSRRSAAYAWAQRSVGHAHIRNSSGSPHAQRCPAAYVAGLRSTHTSRSGEHHSQP